MKNDDSDPVSYMIVFQFLATVMIFVYMSITKTPLPTGEKLLNVWPNLLINGTLISLGSVTMFQALKHTKAGEYAIISTFSSFVNLIIASLFLHELLTLNKVMGTILIVTSVLLITEFKRTKEKLKLSRGHLYSLISAISFGSAFANDSFLSAQLGVIQCLLIIFFIPGLFVLLLNPTAIYKTKKLLTRNNLTRMLLYSTLYLLGTITIFAAYNSGGEAGKIYGISNTSVIVTVILAAILLNEKDHLFRKAIATIVAFAGIMLLR